MQPYFASTCIHLLFMYTWPERCSNQPRSLEPSHTGAAGEPRDRKPRPPRADARGERSTSALWQVMIRLLVISATILRMNTSSLCVKVSSSKLMTIYCTQFMPISVNQNCVEVHATDFYSQSDEHCYHCTCAGSWWEYHTSEFFINCQIWPLYILVCCWRFLPDNSPRFRDSYMYILS